MSGEPCSLYELHRRHEEAARKRKPSDRKPLDPPVICKRHASYETDCAIWHYPFGLIVPLGVNLLVWPCHLGHDVRFHGSLMTCETCRFIYSIAEPKPPVLSRETIIESWQRLLWENPREPHGFYEGRSL